MLSQTLTAFHDAVSLLLRGQVERRNVLEGLDLVLLAADETVDDGYVFCYPPSLCLLSMCSGLVHQGSSGGNKRDSNADIIGSFWKRTQLLLPLESQDQGPILPISSLTNKPFVMLVCRSPIS